MFLSLTAFLTIAYSIASATPSIAQSNDCNSPVETLGSIANSILLKYIHTETGIYKIHADEATWNDARNICLDEGAQLAVIGTEAEEAMLMKHMKENDVNSAWIGVHDLFELYRWTTITGQRLDSLEYVHWASGEPNNFNERCVEMHMGGMNDQDCKARKAFVCEKADIIDISFGDI